MTLADIVRWSSFAKLSVHIKLFPHSHQSLYIAGPTVTWSMPHCKSRLLSAISQQTASGTSWLFVNPESKRVFNGNDYYSSLQWTCLNVCLLAHLKNHTSKLHKIFCTLPLAMASTSSWWQCNRLCTGTSGFPDDVMFADIFGQATGNILKVTHRQSLISTIALFKIRMTAKCKQVYD